MRAATVLVALIVSAMTTSATAAECPRYEIPTIQLEGNCIQGGMVIGRTKPGTRLTLDGRSVLVSKEGYFLLAFGRDAGPTADLVRLGAREMPEGIVVPRLPPFSLTLPIAKRDYDIQRIDGLPRRKVTPHPEDLVRIRAEGRLMRDARSGKTLQLGFLSGFVWPAPGRISGVYGSQRILNGEPRRPHFGVDIAAPTGTPVIAPADGQVTLVHPDMFFNGKSIVMDHGLGLTTVYIHLSDASVQPGQLVKQGDVIGKIGETGRATGPHLHWGARVRNIEIDPALLVEGKPQPPNGR